MNLGTFRKTSQHLAPARPVSPPPEIYNIYPVFPAGPGKIGLGYDALAAQLLATKHNHIIIDGFGDILWQHFVAQLDAAFRRRQIQAKWQNVQAALLPESQINQLIAPFLGGDDPIFGTRFTGTLRDFFDPEKLKKLKPDDESELNIIYGAGSALANWPGLLVYVDVPKNEIQFRSRAGSISNLGASQPGDSQKMYKRFYFVDWPVLNRRKAHLLPKIDLIVDAQRPDEPAVMKGTDFRAALETMAHNYFRVRPWFEPGPWGGQWIKANIPQLTTEVPNYAWSFEMIAPENGIAFESDEIMLEVSFDFLMFNNYREVLGDFAERFGYEFPIRYDFLDTFDGGNLSVQCHPRPEYIHQNFGETFTQDECYYILDCKPDARVYLGFQADIRPEEFRDQLERSFQRNVPVHIDKYVNSEPAHKHDFFLIPHGTIHSSGKNNLVLEISATPYIFTFKMYDWLRLDLNGKPRPLNIARAFENLYFERRGAKIKAELVSQPALLQSGNDWQLYHLPTHPQHFYDVHRFEFMTSVEVKTAGSCHVMSLVEGESIILELPTGMRQRFNYAETFVIPAAAGSYRLINEGRKIAKVVKTFLKPWAQPYAKSNANEPQPKRLSLTEVELSQK
ncbi:MAG: class I mannose-6-phosphate isomerase [bacterium]